MLDPVEMGGGCYREEHLSRGIALKLGGFWVERDHSLSEC